MKSKRLKSKIHYLLILIGFLVLPREAIAFCHEIELVKKTVKSGLVSRPSSALWQVTDRSSLFTPLAAKSDGDSVRIKWFGHATFQITSSNGTRILTDPHIRDYLPVPTLPQHIVTTSHNHTPHSNIWMARGNPVILEGLSQLDDDWNVIHRNIRDVSVYTVPAYHDKSHGLQRGKNAIFVFRVNDICIAHLGDLGHQLTPSQLKMLGKIDVLLVPIAGGMYTVPADEAREVTKQVKPRIAIPMHYWWEGGAEEFSAGFPRVRVIKGHTLKISKKQLPKQTEIVILSWDND
ncbi:MAG: MBL fold metallo-hydrolase [Deltaproteobacteria bacterium]|nr:MBL fold metallo-hydrolase [Deltaproteobacteria bacterium]